MSFYEDYQKSLKKATNTKSNLFSALPKLKQEEESTVLKPYSNKNTRKVLKNSSEHKNLLNLPDYEEIKPRKVLTKPSLFDFGRIKTLIGNPNEKNEPVKLPNEIDPFNSEPKISKLPYKPYKPDSLNGNLGFGKLPDLNREGWEIDPKFSISGKGSNIDPKFSISGKGPIIDPGFSRIPNSKREGSRIKGNVQNVLINRLGELDARHIFDGIDDDTIERNKPTAVSIILDNIKKGYITLEQLEKYPHMLDGMTMYLAASDSGNSKAARFSRDVAYSEGEPEKQTLLDYSPHSVIMDTQMVSKIADKSDDLSLYSKNDVQLLSNPVYTTENVYDILEKTENSTYYPNKTERKLLEAALKNRSTPISVADRIKKALEKVPVKITEADPGLLAKSKPIEKEPMAHEKSIEEKNAELETLLNAVSFLPGVGDIADIGVAALDALDGDWGSAVLGLAGLIPGADAFTDTTRIARKADNVVDAAKVADDVADFSKFPKTIHSGKQGKHIVGHNNYKTGKSILDISEEKANDFLKKFTGKGTPLGNNKERVDFGEVIGQYVDPKTGKAYETTKGIIHYSNNGAHIVPANPNS